MKMKWKIWAYDVNDVRRIFDSPLFENRKQAEIWHMKYTAEHADDIINYELVYEDGKNVLSDLGCVIEYLWTGHDWPKTW